MNTAFKYDNKPINVKKKFCIYQLTTSNFQLANETNINHL